MGRIYDASWGRLFAAAYDRALKGSEEAGLAELRRRLLAGARGKVVELGAGTGLNLDLYPAEGIEELVLTEPDPHMARRLRERLARGERPARVAAAPAERLPFPDADFDTVVATLMLCTVPDPAAALAEAARVLRPGGRLLFLEHVRAADPRLARWQDRFEAPWRFFADGCRCNRDTLARIEASPLQTEAVEHGVMPKAMPILRPLISGSAVRP